MNLRTSRYFSVSKYLIDLIFLRHTFWNSIVSRGKGKIDGVRRLCLQSVLYVTYMTHQ